MHFVDVQVFVAFPDIVVILLDDLSVDEAKLDVDCNGSLEQIPVDELTIPIFGYLLNESAFELILNIFEALVSEVDQSTHCQALHVGVLQVVAILCVG